MKVIVLKCFPSNKKNANCIVIGTSRYINFTKRPVRGRRNLFLWVQVRQDGY